MNGTLNRQGTESQPPASHLFHFKHCLPLNVTLGCNTRVVLKPCKPIRWHCVAASKSSYRLVTNFSCCNKKEGNQSGALKCCKLNFSSFDGLCSRSNSIKWRSQHPEKRFMVCWMLELGCSHALKSRCSFEGVCAFSSLETGSISEHFYFSLVFVYRTHSGSNFPTI